MKTNSTKKKRNKPKPVAQINIARTNPSIPFANTAAPEIMNAADANSATIPTSGGGCPNSNRNAATAHARQVIEPSTLSSVN